MTQEEKTTRIARTQRLVQLMSEAIDIYNGLMDDAISPIDRLNWKLDKDHTEQAMFFAAGEERQCQ